MGGHGHASEARGLLSDALGTLSEEELADLRDRLLPREVERRKEVKKSEARLALDALAAKYGFSIDELYPDPSRIPLPRDGSEDPYHFPVPGLSPEKPRATEDGSKDTTRQVKFRAPHDPHLEWCGRGRKPIWLTHYIESGGNIDDLRVVDRSPDAEASPE